MILTLITIVRHFFLGLPRCSGGFVSETSVGGAKNRDSNLPMDFSGAVASPLGETQGDPGPSPRETAACWWGQFQNKVMMFFFPNQCKRDKKRRERLTVWIFHFLSSFEALMNFISFCKSVDHGIPLKLTQKDLQELAAFHHSQLQQAIGSPQMVDIFPRQRIFKKGNSTPPVFAKGDGIHLHLESLRCHFSKGQAVSLCPRSWFDPDLYGSESEAEVVEDGWVVVDIHLLL